MVTGWDSLCEFVSVLRNFLRALLTSFQLKKILSLHLLGKKNLSSLLFRFRLRGLQISQKIDERKKRQGLGLGELTRGSWQTGDF